MGVSEVTDDLYGLLGVPADAGLQEIKRAYRRRARELHPDARGHRATEERFAAVTVAYETLRDPEHRRRYDHGRLRAEEEERRRRAEAADRIRREEARRRDEEFRRREEEHRRREEERRRRYEEDRLRREEQERSRRKSRAALAAVRRHEEERIARQRRRRALAPRVLLASAAVFLALGIAGTLLTLDGRAQALSLHRDGTTATATVRAFHEEAASAGGQPATDAVARTVDVEFNARDGSPRAVRLANVRDEHRAGEKLAVVYDDAGRVELADPCGQGESLACGRHSLSYLGLSALGVIAGVAFLVASFSTRRRLSA